MFYKDNLILLNLICPQDPPLVYMAKNDIHKMTYIRQINKQHCSKSLGSPI